MLLHLLTEFVNKHKLGVVLPPDATMRLFPGLVRLPDVSFFSWDRLPGGEFPDTPVPAVAPDLAAEVVSKGNTRKEMVRKVGEYFRSDVRLVWLIYPRKRLVEVYTSPKEKQMIREGQLLDGGQVLPGFSLRLSELFALPKNPRTA